MRRARPRRRCAPPAGRGRAPACRRAARRTRARAVDDDDPAVAGVDLAADGGRHRGLRGRRRRDDRGALRIDPEGERERCAVELGDHDGEALAHRGEPGGGVDGAGETGGDAAERVAREHRIRAVDAVEDDHPAVASVDGPAQRDGGGLGAGADGGATGRLEPEGGREGGAVEPRDHERRGFRRGDEAGDGVDQRRQAGHDVRLVVAALDEIAVVDAVEPDHPAVARVDRAVEADARGARAVRDGATAVVGRIVDPEAGDERRAVEPRQQHPHAVAHGGEAGGRAGRRRKARRDVRERVVRGDDVHPVDAVEDDHPGLALDDRAAQRHGRGPRSRIQRGGAARQQPEGDLQRRRVEAGEHERRALGVGGVAVGGSRQRRVVADQGGERGSDRGERVAGLHDVGAIDTVDLDDPAVARIHRAGQGDGGRVGPGLRARQDGRLDPERDRERAGDELADHDRAVRSCGDEAVDQVEAVRELDGENAGQRVARPDDEEVVGAVERDDPAVADAEQACERDGRRREGGAGHSGTRGAGRSDAERHRERGSVGAADRERRALEAGREASDAVDRQDEAGDHLRERVACLDGVAAVDAVQRHDPEVAGLRCPGQRQRRARARRRDRGAAGRLDAEGRGEGGAAEPRDHERRRVRGDREACGAVDRGDQAGEDVCEHVARADRVGVVDAVERDDPAIAGIDTAAEGERGAASVASDRARGRRLDPERRREDAAVDAREHDLRALGDGREARDRVELPDERRDDVRDAVAGGDEVRAGGAVQDDRPAVARVDRADQRHRRRACGGDDRARSRAVDAEDDREGRAVEPRDHERRALRRGCVAGGRTDGERQRRRDGRERVACQRGADIVGAADRHRPAVTRVHRAGERDRLRRGGGRHRAGAGRIDPEEHREGLAVDAREHDRRALADGRDVACGVREQGQLRSQR